MKFWTDYTLSDNKYYHCRIGPLVIWMIKSHNELLICEQRIAKGDLEENWENALLKPAISKNPDLDNWKRWVIGEKKNTVSLMPSLPNRPVIVRPESPIHILTGNKTCFYVSIPLSIKIISGLGNLLVEIPTHIMSNIWFGEPISGELCYSVKSKAVTSIDNKKIKTYAAICPICIENGSPKLFNFARFAIHTEYLGVFAGDKHLWTNQIDVKLEGDEQKSIINITENAPQIESQTIKLTESRETPSRKLYKKMFSDFSFFKS